MIGKLWMMWSGTEVDPSTPDYVGVVVRGITNKTIGVRYFEPGFSFAGPDGITRVLLGNDELEEDDVCVYCHRPSIDRDKRV